MLIKIATLQRLPCIKKLPSEHWALLQSSWGWCVGPEQLNGEAILKQTNKPQAAPWYEQQTDDPAQPGPMESSMSLFMFN